jgi:hypothetical protein
VANVLLYRHDEARLEVVEHGRPWSFDRDGALFRLVSEAHRTHMAHPVDPVFQVVTSNMCAAWPDKAIHAGHCDGK